MMRIKCTKNFLNFRYLICLILSDSAIPCQMFKFFARQMPHYKMKIAVQGLFPLEV